MHDLQPSVQTVQKVQKKEVTCEREQTYGVLLLLDVQNGAILEGPLDDVGLGAGALDHLALLELAPEGGELLQLDEVPDGAEGGLDDGRLADGGGGGNGRHCENRELVFVVTGYGYLFERVECLWNGKLKFLRSNCLLYNILLGPTTSWKLPLPPPLRSRQYARDQFATGPTSALPC